MNMQNSWVIIKYRKSKNNLTEYEMSCLRKKTTIMYLFSTVLNIKSVLFKIYLSFSVTSIDESNNFNNNGIYENVLY